MVNVELSEEEFLFIQHRREAVQEFINFCKRPYPSGEYAWEEDLKAQRMMEERLVEKWGFYV